MKTDWKPGDHVRIDDFADNFVGMTGTVVKVGEVTCAVEINEYQYTGTFFFRDLIPLEDEII